MLGLTEKIVEISTAIISQVGPLGIAILMALESMIAPVPSEAVMPFAGFLWFTGELSWLAILISSTIGSIIGSLLSYYMGLWGGPPIVRWLSRYRLLNEHHLELTERFFHRYGEKAIFISRFIPIVRHFISILAGLGKMTLGKFLVYTTIGAAMWNMILAYAGYLLGSHWEVIRRYSEILDWLIVIAIIIAAIYFFFRLRQRPKPSPPPLA